MLETEFRPRASGRGGYVTRVVMREPVPCVNPLRCSSDLDLATPDLRFFSDWAFPGGGLFD